MQILSSHIVGKKRTKRPLNWPWNSETSSVPVPDATWNSCKAKISLNTSFNLSCRVWKENVYWEVFKFFSSISSLTLKMLPFVWAGLQTIYLCFCCYPVPWTLRSMTCMVVTCILWSGHVSYWQCGLFIDQRAWHVWHDFMNKTIFKKVQFCVVYFKALNQRLIGPQEELGLRYWETLVRRQGV